MNILKVLLSNVAFQPSLKMKLFLGLSFLSIPSALVYGADDLAMSEWRNYGNTLQSTKYSPLQQIDASNVGELEIAWMWNTPDNEIFRTDPRATAAEYKVTPIMVNGILYVSTSLGVVAAIDAKSGDGSCANR